jgi:hypothetical protein
MIPSGPSSCGGDGEENNRNNEGNNGKNDGAQKTDKEYIKFFKFYYEKTKNEHSNWTPAQITKIISLLWKKKKNIDKVPSKAGSTTSRRSNKPLSAKDAFRMSHKNLSKEEFEETWSKLPKESKNFWKKEGDSYCTVSAKSSDVSSVKNCKTPVPIYNAMKALLKNI